MNTDPQLLHALVPLALSFALALARIGGVVMLLPGVGETVVPPTMRAGFAVAVTLLLMPSITMPPPPDFIMLAALLAHELAVGIWLGIMARMFVLALPIAGQIISYQIGLSSVITPSSDLGAESTLMSTVFGLFATTLILASGLYSMPLQALVASYRILPVGLMFPAGGVLHIAEALTTQSFALAIQLSMPFLLAGLLWQVGLAVISKLVPQLQIYLVALPGQTLGGLALLALLATAITVAWQRGVASGMTRLLTG